VDYKNQPPDPYPRRRGRTPKPTDHPIGRQIRERRLALGLSLAQLAEKVGIGPTSVSLIAAMEHGTLPPRRDVAEQLADVLGLDKQMLVEWSSMRVSPHMPSEVLARRERYDEALRDAWETNLDTLDVPAFMRSTASPPPTAARRPGMAAPPPPAATAARGFRLETEASRSEAPAGKITVYPAGVDPDRFRGSPSGFVDRAQIETLVQGKAELIRPIAYLVPLQDLERLRRSSYPPTPPTCAIVSRPLPVVIDSREPYAIRYGKTVILAYCAWDGRELVVLEPPGQRGFVRIKARNEDALEELVVGQVVALSWFPIE
jgi:transcriptional regulator with XRE-family HTH domain